MPNVDAKALNLPVEYVPFCRRNNASGFQAAARNFSNVFLKSGSRF
jgi:hypothetical protein